MPSGCRVNEHDESTVKFTQTTALTQRANFKWNDLNNRMMMKKRWAHQAMGSRDALKWDARNKSLNFLDLAVGCLCIESIMFAEKLNEMKKMLP